MSIVRSPVRSVVRSPVRGVFGGADTQTDLQRLLALSPSLLIWPANGAGWQGTSGGTLAASGQPLGLGADLSQLGGKTLGEWLATAPELVTNGDFASDTAWTKGTGWTISGGAARRSPAAGTTAIQQIIGWDAAKVYVIEIAHTVTAGTLTIRSDTVSGTIIFTATASGLSTAVVRPTSTTGTIFISGNTAFDGSVESISVRELPGNHLRAGTWASPSDAARGTLQVSGGVTWLDPDATNDQYSFLTALSARAIVARVRVPTAYTTDDRFLTNDAETVNVSVNGGNWTATDSGAIRINGASGAAFAVDTWQTLTIEWGSGQAFSRIWYSATASQFGSMDIAALAVSNSALSAGDRAIYESVIGATA
jgi:hypothetical protein